MLQANQIFQQCYQLKEKLAQNAGRQTWLAEDISIQPAQTVILKFLSFGENFQWQDLKLFEREADILKQLSHPKIPKYRDYFSLEDKSNWFALVEEYIPGESLKQLIETKKRFSEEELRKIASEVLEILCYLHTLNPRVVHRDIKPSNLILGIDKKVYLIDFGAVQDSAAAKGATFTVVGTYGYAPIEQFGGRTVPASDLYALGATLIHLATGRIPADLPQAKMRIQFQEQVSLSDGFIRWIEKLTEPDIDDRFSSAEEALTALNSNLKVNSSTDNSQLQDSRLTIKKYDKKLELKIAAEGGKAEHYLSLLVLFLLFPIFFVSPLLLGIFSILLVFFIPLFFSILHSRCETVYIHFNPKNFMIEWKRNEYNIRCIKGKTSEIKAIRKSFSDAKNAKSRQLLIEVGAKAYLLSRNLNEADTDRLIKEIQDWSYNL
jgi:serine/threonine protein kinase